MSTYSNTSTTNQFTITLKNGDWGGVRYDDNDMKIEEIMNMKKGIIIALIMLSVGFAVVSTSLAVSGNIKLGFHEEDYEIYFSKAIVDGKDKSQDIIDKATRKKITYETSELKSIGDKSVLDFEVTNNSKQYDAEVTINCVPTDADTISEYVTIKNSMPLTTIKAQKRGTGTITVELKKSSIETISANFSCTITATATEREKQPEVLLAENSCENIAIPTLDEGNKLIPVTISDNGTITKVSKDNSEWYNYCEKKWANAVILKDEEDAPDDNQTIDMAKIESMFVWIPKYKYRLWNVETKNTNVGVHTIDIEFDTEDTIDEDGVSCATPKNSGVTGNCNDGEYMTHPAFLAFGGDGFWIGKFEVGYKDATDTNHAQVNSSDYTKIIIKPEAYSWRNNTVKNMFTAAKDYSTNLGSHMLKNTEWGAVAYLSHSIFGINKEVTINNNNKYKTGYAALPETDQSKMPGTYGDGANYNTAWNTTNGFTASTTGNITGVYDMSGGAWEYMAAYVAENPKNSGFQADELSALEAKFVDVYDKSSTINSYEKMILGDATGEMGPFSNYQDGDGVSRWHNLWYADYSHFADASYPWFTRGGHFSNGVIAGQFYFHRHTGAVDGGDGFRLALAFPVEN